MSSFCRCASFTPDYHPAAWHDDERHDADCPIVHRALAEAGAVLFFGPCCPTFHRWLADQLGSKS